MVAEADTVSHKSPFYAELNDKVTRELQLPPGLMDAIVRRGERSDADQVSEAGAKTVYQIIPETRDAALKKYGIDAYLNPESAAKVAGHLLSDSLKRNNNITPLAVAEYVGGTDPKNWGSQTRAYVQRVTGEKLITDAPNPRQSTYERIIARKEADATPQIARVQAAYQAGQMSPDDAAAYEADVAAGRVLPPKGSKVKAPAAVAESSAIPEAPAGVIDAYTSGGMTPQDKHDFETDVAEGHVRVPAGVQVAKPEGFVKRAADATFEAISGAARSTPEIEALPDWATMPEFTGGSGKALKAGIGTLFASPSEAVKVMKEQYPDMAIRQDEKGNYILKSRDGKDYAIKPGMRPSDVPRIAAAAGAFTPAGAARTVLGAGAAAAGTEAAIQASQAATGGDFDVKDVALAGAGGAVVPFAGRLVDAVKPAVTRVVDAVKSRLPGAAMRAEAEGAPAAAAAPTEPPVPPTTPPAAPPSGGGAPPAEVPPPVAAAAAPVETGGVKKISTEGLSPTMTPLRIAEKNLADGKPSVTPDAPVEVSYNIDTGKYSLVDGYHRYLAARGGSIEKALQQAEKGEFPEILADVSLVKNKVDAHGSIEPVPLTKAERKEYLAKTATPPPPVEPAAVPPTGSAPPAAAAPTQTAEELAAVTRKAAGGGFGSKAATQELAQAATPDAETVAAAKRLGIDEHLQPDHVTTNDAYRTLAAVVKSIPASEAKAAEVRGLAKVAERADELITELGGSRDMSALNAGVKAELTKIEKSFKSQAGELYDAVAARVQPKTPAPADNVLQMIKARAEELGGVEHLSAGERKILATLAPKEGVQPTYALLDQTRKDIGEAARGANEAFGTRDSRLLNALQSALRADQEAVATAAGAGEIWNAANAATRAYKGVQDDLKGLFGKELSASIVGDLSRSVKALSAGDVSGFIKLVKATPESMRHELVASGLASAFNNSAAKGGINFSNYVNWFEGLQRNRIARDALFSNLPKEAVQRLTDLYKVSKGIAASTGQFIATGRLLAAPVKQILEADNLLSHIFDVAKRAGAAEALTSTVGLPGTGVAAAVGAALAKGRTPVMKAADSLINSPEFIAAARNASKNNINRLARSTKFVRFVKAAGSPREMKDGEKWVAQALQAKKESGK